MITRLVFFRYIFGTQDIFAWSGLCSIAVYATKKSQAGPPGHPITGRFNSADLQFLFTVSHVDRYGMDAARRAREESYSQAGGKDTARIR
jgi:hypothetical protein